MSRAPAALRRGETLWRRLQRLPEQMLFGPRSEQAGIAGWWRRGARYPYALLRDLAGGQLNLHAMGLVYTSLLAIIPLLAFSFGILKALHAQGELQPLVHDFFVPMGPAGEQLSAQIMDFANTVRGGIVGLVGFALLIWTLIGTLKKIEDGFNFVWHVDVPRSFARRTTEYAALLITGPVLLAAVIGLSRLAARSAPWRMLAQLPLLDRLAALALTIAPYVIVSGLLSLLYLIIPNTHVRLRAALIGGVAAGILWAAVGRFFTLFVIDSTRLTIVYAGFAIIIAALLWTYFNWIILLLGAQVSFYAQNPGYLRLGMREPRLSCSDTELLALAVMYRIAEAQRAATGRVAVATLAEELGYPGIAVARLCAALEQAGYLAVTPDESLLPARSVQQIRLLDLLRVARAISSGVLRDSGALPQPVLQLHAELDRAWQLRCGTSSIADLLPADRSLAGNRHGINQ
jgi:membrane protein